MNKVALLFMVPVITFGLTFGEIKETSVVYSAGEETSSEVMVEEDTEDEQGALDEVKSWMSEHFNSQLVANIITWVSDAGLLMGLLGIYIKYKKIKGKTVEQLVGDVNANVLKVIEDNFDKMSVEKLAGLVKKVGNLEQSVETIMKVLVLMQDSTRTGKVALLDFLGSKTNNEEIKAKAEEVTAEIKQEEAKEQEVKEAVKEDYKEIF